MLVVPRRRTTAAVRPLGLPPGLELDAAPLSPLPLVSVVVACYGALRHTQNLVRSLRENAGCAYELILVDDGCPERTWEWAAREGITCLRHERNQGLPRTINDGARAAQGGILALWNSDLLVHPGGLRKLAEAAQRRGIAAMTGGYFLPGGHYGGQTPELWRSDYPEGYCLTLRRDVWETVGEWDPVYHPTICDDSDWALRARLKGYRWTFVTDAIHHIGGQSCGSAKLPPGYVSRNQETLRRKYAPLGLGERILVRRWGAHGDLLMATPAIRALKAEKPLAHLHVLCHDEAGRVLVGLPYVDAVFNTPPRDVQYSRVVDLNGAYEDGQRRGVYEHPATAFCRVAGVAYDGQPYDLALPDHFRAWGRSVLPEGTRWVACGLRSAHRSKQNWRAEKWLALADALPAGWKLVALDAERQPTLGHQPTAAEAQFYAHPNVEDWTGRTESLPHAAALVSACEAFVGIDSGLLHVAHALGLPTVNLCAAAPEKARTPLVGRNLALEGRADCFPCSAPTHCPQAAVGHCLDGVEARQIVTWLSKLF